MTMQIGLNPFWKKRNFLLDGAHVYSRRFKLCLGNSAGNQNCSVFVLILSKNAQKSKWVPRELDQAINENKIVMPFDIDDCALQDDFNFYLTNVQRYNAYQNKSKAIEKCFQKSKQSWAFMII